MDDEIKVGNYIVIKRQKYTKLHKYNKLDSTVLLGKEQVELGEIAGKPYWTTFKMVAKGDIKKRLYALETCEQMTADIKSVLNKVESGSDNRNVVDDGSSQTLSRDELEELRYVKGTGSKEIVEQLVENSKTFNSKTEFSQEKYLKKKEKKYFEYIQVLRPTVRLMAEIFYRQDPEKIMNLRKDSLSQILTYANVSSSGTYLLYDSGSNGLLAATIMSSIGRDTEARLVQMHPGNFDQRQALAALNMETEQSERCVSVNIYSCLRQFHQKTSNGESVEEPPLKRQKTDETEEETPTEKKKPKWFFENEKACELLEKRVDGLVIASKEHPKSILDNLLPFVKPSRQVVVFNQSREVLAELFGDLRCGSRVTAIRQTSNWLRNYQVLSNRTHPEITMSGNGGFLLTGTTTE